MNFSEFLLATGKEKFYDVLQSNDWDLINVLFGQFEVSLRNYCYVGGMPEAVQAFADTGDYTKVRKIQSGYVAPLEAKAEQDLKAKSLKRFTSNYQSPFIFRKPISPYFKGDSVTDIPLFAVTKAVEIMSRSGRHGDSNVD